MEVSGHLHASAVLSAVRIGQEAGWPPQPVWVAVKRKILHCRDSNPGRPAVRYTGSKFGGEGTKFTKCHFGPCDLCHGCVLVCSRFQNLNAQLRRSGHSDEKWDDDGVRRAGGSERGVNARKVTRGEERAGRKWSHGVRFVENRWVWERFVALRSLLQGPVVRETLYSRSPRPYYHGHPFMLARSNADWKWIRSCGHARKSHPEIKTCRNVGESAASQFSVCCVYWEKLQSTHTMCTTLQSVFFS
jgi:hypothetical protein